MRSLLKTYKSISPNLTDSQIKFFPTDLNLILIILDSPMKFTALEEKNLLILPSPIGLSLLRPRSPWVNQVTRGHLKVKWIIIIFQTSSKNPESVIYFSWDRHLAGSLRQIDCLIQKECLSWIQQRLSPSRKILRLLTWQYPPITGHFRLFGKNNRFQTSTSRWSLVITWFSCWSCFQGISLNTIYSTFIKATLHSRTVSSTRDRRTD